MYAKPNMLKYTKTHFLFLPFHFLNDRGKRIKIAARMII
jgi:hypothetical protein